MEQGKYVLEMDGFSLIAILPKDTVMFRKEIDSVFVFKHLVEQKKDSLSKLSIEEQEKIKKLKFFLMRININQERKKYLFLLETPFNPDSALDFVVKQNF
ncbi:hypothetical protein BWK59_08735 [Flavobacterium davisii]|uniref:Uncharacterized protein n=1 Tax=Flavobacterium davisii TaxID=2906077 RepID=A0A246GHV0_9FLAO|nr:hypothetical protein [Flavobacterium davisii]OWP83776.1 hypothetical protein BWK59_08735 [Flavobacterium davisii]